jgi:hypothetical protein
MFKKFAMAAVALASLTAGTLALSGSAQADDMWKWRHRHHHFHGGDWGRPYGGIFFGGPGLYFGGPYYGDDYYYNDGYYDPPAYWPHRHCHIKKVKRHHHWVSKRVCHIH